MRAAFVSVLLVVAVVPAPTAPTVPTAPTATPTATPTTSPTKNETNTTAPTTAPTPKNDLDPGILMAFTILTVGLALLFDFTNGFHDAANATATVIASRSLKPLPAVLLAAIFNFAPALSGQTSVANTISKTVDVDSLPNDLASSLPPGISVTLAALVGATFWNIFTWKFGIPSSSSHALIGGLVGAGIGTGGFDVVTWSELTKIIIAIFASPALAFTLACLVMLLTRFLMMVSKGCLTEDHTVFRVLQIIACCALSWAHGSNDAQKTMGIIAATLYAAGYLDADNSKSLVPPIWVVLSAHGFICMGTIFGGWSIIETMGMNITLITRASGFAANCGAVSAIEGATSLGVPISTTQAAASSVMGSGVSAGRQLGWNTLRNMAAAWLVTIPAATGVGMLVVQVARIPEPYGLISAVLVVLVLLVWGGYEAKNAKSMKDVQDRIPTEGVLATGETPQPLLKDGEKGAGATDEEADVPVRSKQTRWQWFKEEMRFDEFESHNRVDTATIHLDDSRESPTK